MKALLHSGDGDWIPVAQHLLVGLLAGAAGVAGSFAVAGLSPSFVAGPIAGLLARRLPAELITFAIVVLGDLGARLNLLAAVLLATALLAGTALVGLVIGRRAEPRWAGPLAASGLCWVAAFAVTRAPAASIAAGLAAGAVLSAAELVAGRDEPATIAPDRRRILGGIASAFAIGIGGYVLGRRANRTGSIEGLGLSPSVTAEIETLLGDAEEKSMAVDGLEPLVSDDFYQVDINATDPIVDAGTWVLAVTGNVDSELTYTYEDIRSMAPENHFVTLRCVGESLNGKKLDNALWTGVPIWPLVEPAGIDESCCVMLRAADGFYEEFPLSALRDGFLAYGMNGEPLPRQHGHPARALIPGHWGEINVKWITEIEVLETEAIGYWEERGWHGTGPVNTVAKLHVVNELADGRIEVAGHAYAGTRGIDRVEVSTDGGDRWHDALLSDRLPGEDVWRQWVYRYDAPVGEHRVVVRATDGTGERQPEEWASAFPSGPSGWVSRTVGR